MKSIFGHVPKYIVIFSMSHSRRLCKTTDIAKYFSGPRKYTFRYLLFGITGVEMLIERKNKKEQKEMFPNHILSYKRVLRDISVLDKYYQLYFSQPGHCSRPPIH